MFDGQLSLASKHWHPLYCQNNLDSWNCNVITYQNSLTKKVVIELALYLVLTKFVPNSTNTNFAGKLAPNLMQICPKYSAENWCR